MENLRCARSFITMHYDEFRTYKQLVHRYHLDSTLCITDTSEKEVLKTVYPVAFADC